MQKTSVKRKQPSDGDGEKTGSKEKAIRRRATIACEECRARKRRCDGSVPACGACMKRLTKCVYASDIEAKEWRSSMITSLRNQLRELENAEHSLQSATSEVEDDSTVIRSSDGHSPRTQKTLATRSELGDQIVRLDENIPQTSQLPSFPTAHSAFVENVILKGPDDDIIPRSPVLHQLASAQSTFRLESPEPSSLEKMMKPINQIIDKKDHCGEPPANSRGTYSASSMSFSDLDQMTITCNCDHLLDTRQWSLPLRRRADSLVSRYFRKVNMTFPILHERTFRRQYARLWHSAPDQDGTHPTVCSGLCKQRSQGQLFPATVYAVFALSSLFETKNLEQNATKADAFFHLLQKVDLLEILDNEMGIELIQLLLLMGFYLQSTERFSKCKNISGLTIRMAENMGLHYSVSEARRRGLLSSLPTQLDCEIRARVWNGCVMLEREIALAFGRSDVSAVSARAFVLPESIDDHRLSEEIGKTNKQPKDSLSFLQPYIQVLKLYDILGQILDQDELYPEHAPEAATSIQSILKLDTRIIEWRDALPAYLHCDSSWDGRNWEEAVSLDTQPPCPEAFFDSAKKLYLRFLNARQLILRPALELLFKKQQSGQPLSHKRSTDFGLEDLMLGRIAAQCVMSAMTAVKLLDFHRDSHNFMAWWLNVAFLHTSGTTILMGRLCTFTDATFSDESLIANWEICLENLAHYAGLSSVARKSFYLLQQSAKRLIPLPQCQVTNLEKEAFGGEGENSLNQRSMKHVSGFASGINTQNNIEGLSRVVGNALEKPPSHTEPPQVQPMAMSFLDPDPRFGTLQGVDEEFWGTELGTSNWPLLPFLSQLESLSPRFDF